MTKKLKEMIKEVMEEEVNTLIDQFYISGCNYKRIANKIIETIKDRERSKEKRTEKKLRLLFEIKNEIENGINKDLSSYDVAEKIIKLIDQDPETSILLTYNDCNLEKLKEILKENLNQLTNEHCTHFDDFDWLEDTPKIINKYIDKIVQEIKDHELSISQSYYSDISKTLQGCGQCENFTKKPADCFKPKVSISQTFEDRNRCKNCNTLILESCDFCCMSCESAYRIKEREEDHNV